MTETETPDFDAIEQLLSASAASWEAAEAHGAFCGRACLSGVASIRAWVDELLAESDAADVLAKERAKTLETLAANTILQLEAGDMSFNLLMPDDNESLYIRTAALVDWCHGFMHGMVSAGGADEGPQADALEAEVVSEILDDFSEITKAGAGEDEGEESESAFAELIEYVRVSAQLVYDETAALRAKYSTGSKGGSA
jgi:uncharacterized protein YgfB (UPF0149 family)